MSDSRKQSFLSGAAILAATVAITKVIGFIYKIPIYNILGDEGTAHFQVTYTIYNLLLTISTAGVPVALSRLISSARATNRPNQVKRYFSTGFMTFGIVGIIGMLAMFFFAQNLADFMGDHEVSGGVRALAPAVLFACVISVYRGYSQGHNDMLPTAISQIMEVLCKLIFGLAIAWYLSGAGYSSSAVSAGAIVGVTIGLGLAIPIVSRYCHKLMGKSDADAVNDIPDSRVDTFKNILKIGIPITLGSSILNIINLIDSKLVLERLQYGAGFSYEMAKILYGAYSKGLTLFNFPSAFITPVAVAVVPVVSSALARRDGREAKKVMESSMKLTNLFALPAAVGMCVLSYPIYNVLYPGSNENGPRLLAVLAIASFFVCTYIITNGLLQASGYEKLALLTLPIGGVVKIIVNWFLVGSESVNIMGAPIGTLACYVAITALNVIFITVKLKDHPNFIKITLRPAFCTAVMGAAAVAVYNLSYRFTSSLGGRTGMMAAMLIAIAVAVIVYFLLVAATGAVTKEDLESVPKGGKIAKLLKLR